MLKEESNKVILGDDQLGGGQFIRQNIKENAQRFGFNEEQFKEFSEWAQYQTAYELGAFTEDKGEIDVGATNRLRADRAAASSRNKENAGKVDNIKLLIDKTRSSVINLIDSGDLDGANVAVQDLAGIKGYSVETPDPSRPSIISIIGPESVTGGDAVKLEEIDITSRGGLQKLYNLLGVKSLVSGVSNKLTKAQKESNLDAEVSSYTQKYNEKNKGYDKRPGDEEGFINSFSQSDEYNLETLGVELNYTNNFTNIVTATDSEGNSLGDFDPETKVGREINGRRL